MAYRFTQLWLVAAERGGAFVGSAKSRLPGLNRSPSSFTEQRMLLTRLFPGDVLVSPLERLPPFAEKPRFVTVWLSESADGSSGRAGEASHDWAVYSPLASPANSEPLPQPKRQLATSHSDNRSFVR